MTYYPFLTTPRLTAKVAKKPAIADIPAATRPFIGSSNRPATPRPPSVVKKSTAATIAESISAFFQSKEPSARYAFQ